MNMKNVNLPNNTLQLLKAFIASHAVFNALTYVQHQIADDEKRGALKALSVFANFIRKTAQEVDEETRSIEKEVDALKMYCQLEQWRFGDRLTIEIANPNNLQVALPTFLFIPFAEQLILMGLMSSTEKIHLSFSIKEMMTLECHCNFELDKSLITDFSKEQKNRTDLLNKMIELYQQTFHISTKYEANSAELNINPKL